MSEFEVGFGQLAHAAVIRATFAEGQEYLLTSWDFLERPCRAASRSSSAAPQSRRSIEQWKGFLHAANDLFKTMTGGPATAMHFALEAASPALAAASSAGSCLDPCHEELVPPGLQRTAVFMDFPRVLLVLAFGGFLPVDDAVARAQRIFELLQQRLGGNGFTVCTAGPGAKPIASASDSATAHAPSEVHACTGVCCRNSNGAAAVSDAGDGDGSGRPRGICGADCRCGGPVWDRSPDEDTALREGLMAAFDAAAASTESLARAGTGRSRLESGPSASDD